ncbi:hypothetical protein MMC15_006162 [Xylographa vitiligo]|nr:hypothetical protein [Xylographa vitiligo]
MAQPGTAAGSNAAGKEPLDAVKSAIGDVHINLIWNLQGMGETIRGTINGAVDTAFNDKAGEAKNRSIAAKGVAEIQDGELKGHGDGAHAGAVGSMSSVPSVDGGTATSGGGRTL